jgi:hypothetical protein
MNKLLSGACALALLGAAGASHACDTKGQKVMEVMTDDVGSYDENGNLLADLKKSDIELNQNILKCKDTPALVQVSLTPDAKGAPRTAWVNMLEVKVGNGAERKCKSTAPSHLADTSAPAVSGLDPCHGK